MALELSDSEVHRMRRPNILFIMADQLRRDALGCFGNGIVQTPRIDSLAERGMRFDGMYAAYPVCAPNRATIFTGRYPTAHRVTVNGKRLPESETTLMDVLKISGYRTYGSGKMHFGPQWRYPPDGSPLIDPDPSLAVDPQPVDGMLPWYGFDRVAVTEDHRVGPYGRYLAERGYSLDGELHSASYPQSATAASPFPEEHHQTTWITDRALDFLRDHRTDGNREKPFFLKVSYVHPHHPFNPPRPYDAMYDPADMPLPIRREGEENGWPSAYLAKFRASRDSHEAVGLDRFSDADWRRIKAYYYGMVSQIDANIGRILDDLSAAGELGNTLIFFTADHGEMLGDHRLLFQGTTSDCVTGVPFIASGPGIPAGTRGCLCSSVDIMPTVLEIVGVLIPDPSPVQGVSLVPALTDPEHSGRDAVLIENAGERRSVRTREALYTYHGRGTRGELYDLRNDPDCFINLWDAPAAAGLRTSMAERLVGLMAESASDPLPPREGVW